MSGGLSPKSPMKGHWKNGLSGVSQPVVDILMDGDLGSEAGRESECSFFEQSLGKWPLCFIYFSPPTRSAALCDNNIAVIMVCDPDIAFPQRWLMAIVIFQNCLYKQHTESSTKRILMSSAKLFLSQATFLQSIVDKWTFVWPGCTVLCYEFLM